PDAAYDHPAAGDAGARGRLDLHVLAHARRLPDAGADRRPRLAVHRERDLRERRRCQQRPVRGRLRDGADRRRRRLPPAREAPRRLRRPLSMETRATRIGLRVATGIVVAFLWIPLLIIGVYAFNESNIQSWPISGFSFKWFGEAWDNPEVRDGF